MFLASAYTALALYGISDMFNNATLTLYSGTPPATAETALSGNTQLVQYTFASTAFSVVSTSGGYDVQTASFVSASVNGSNTGVATFARVDVVPTSWTATHAYVRGAVVSAGSNYYKCIVTGTSGSSGPSGTSMGQLDGSTAWDYIGPTTGGTTIAQLTVGTANADALLANTTITSGVPATITALRIKTPVN